MKKKILLLGVAITVLMSGCGANDKDDVQADKSESINVEKQEAKTTTKDEKLEKDNKDEKLSSYKDDVYENFYLPKSDFFVLENDSMDVILADGSIFSNLEMFGIDDSLGNKQNHYFYKFEQEKDLTGVTVGVGDKCEFEVSKDLSAEEIINALSLLDAKEGLTPAIKESTPQEVDIHARLEYYDWDQSENDELVLSYKEKPFYGARAEYTMAGPIGTAVVYSIDNKLSFVDHLHISKINGVDLNYVEEITWKYEDGTKNSTQHEYEDYFKSIVDVLGRPKYEYVFAATNRLESLTSPMYTIRYYWEVDDDTYISAELEAERRFLVHYKESDSYACSSIFIGNDGEAIMDYTYWYGVDVKLIIKARENNGYYGDPMLHFVLAVEDMGYGDDNEFFNRK